MLRRSRGHVPAALALPLAAPGLLACGAELKSTFCVAKGARAWVGHHIGDLRNEETLRSFTEGVAHFEELFAVTPEVVAHDLHPDYLSTTYALAREGVEHVAVQHHHAHLAAVLAEHGERGPAVGAIYDGTGYGTDGTVWGGELLAGDLEGFARAGALWPVRLPGGDRAVRQPWRMACAWLAAAGDAEPAPLPGIEPRTWHAVAELARTGLAAPLTTSMGRLFDAVAALCGVRTEVTYEGQAAIELEAVADRSERGAYPLDVAARRARRAPDGRSQWPTTSPPASSRRSSAARFHRAVARATARACAEAAGARGLDTVVLAGGVWQNRLLLELTLAPAARRRPARARARAPAAQRRRHLVRPGGGGRGAQPAAALTKATKSSTSGRAGPTASRMTCHARGGGAGSMAMTPSRPASTSDVTASADRNEIPRPIRAAWRIAPLEPTVSVSPCSALADRNSSLAERVPESGSRSSHVRPPSSPGETGRPPASGSSAALTSTSSLGRNGCASMRSSLGGRPPKATSASWLSSQSRTWPRLPTLEAEPHLRVARPRRPA